MTNAERALIIFLSITVVLLSSRAQATPEFYMGFLLALSMESL